MFIKATTSVNNVQNTITSNEPPVNPTKGQFWVDSSLENPILKMWNGASWVEVTFDIEKIDPQNFQRIKDIISSIENDINDSSTNINDAISKANDALEKAEFNNLEITEIKTKQSEDGNKITEIAMNINGINSTVKDLENKQESQHTELSSMIANTVKNVDSINQQVQTATENIKKIESLEGSNKLIETVNGTVQQIKDVDGKVNQIKSTTDENSFIITDMKGNISSNSQKIDEFNTMVSTVDGKVTEVIQNVDGVKQTVSKVEEGVGNLSTLVEQNAGNISLIGSKDGNPNACLNIGADGKITIGANMSLELNANTKVGEGFTFSADKIQGSSIVGDNLNIDLDNGVVVSKGDFGDLTMKSGEILFSNKEKTKHTGHEFKLAFSGGAFSLYQAGIEWPCGIKFLENVGDEGPGELVVSNSNSSIRFNQKGTFVEGREITLKPGQTQGIIIQNANDGYGGININTGGSSLSIDGTKINPEVKLFEDINGNRLENEIVLPKNINDFKRIRVCAKLTDCETAFYSYVKNNGNFNIRMRIPNIYDDLGGFEILESEISFYDNGSKARVIGGKSYRKYNDGRVDADYGFWLGITEIVGIY